MNYKYLFIALASSAVLLTSVGSAGADFTDVPLGHPYGEAITVLEQNGAIAGNPDGTFKPTNGINRAEFLTLLLRLNSQSLGLEAATSCFPDVALKAWYAATACKGKELGIITGGADGRFRAGDQVTFAEAAKMIATAQSALVEAPAKNEQWYSPYLRYLEKKAAILDSVNYVSQPMKRGEVAEMVWRISEERNDRPAIPAKWIGDNVCEPLPLTTGVPGVNLSVVQTTWLSWYNAERAKVGAAPLSIHPSLNKTAQAWSETAKQRGYIDHKRGTNTYYDYNRIKSWFGQQGVTFTGGGTTFGESIGWNVYSCAGNDCTGTLTSAIRSTFNFFAGEKGKAYRPHYDMMVNRAYKYIGVGVAVDPKTRKYYLTAHLATGVAGNQVAYCPAREL